MKLRHLVIIFLVVGISVVAFWGVNMVKMKSTKFPTEVFIKKQMTNKNGTLATYLKESDVKDSDFVQGREALSETVGLWMNYALNKKDQKLFRESYDRLLTYFLNKDGLVYWKIQPSGNVNVSTNATIDDLRIAHALIKAGELWGNDDYRVTGERIGQFLNKNNRRGDYLSDYYDQKLNQNSEVLTLSYIEPVALEVLVKSGAMDPNVYESMVELLEEIPHEKGFFAKSYHLENKQFSFDNEVNMIDQLLIALHRSQMDIKSEALLSFIKNEFKQKGALFGRYDANSKIPTVQYESPALYGIAILFSLEVGEDLFAKDLYNRMIQFRVGNVFSQYYGGYSINANNNTHIFDNIFPLLAERKLLNKGLK